MSIGPGYACVPCQTYFRPRKNDIRMLETYDDGRPYKVWCADLWECPDCGTQVILGYGQRPIAEQFESDFQVELNKVTHTIIGCLKALP